jgi:hypothetical protein
MQPTLAEMALLTLDSAKTVDSGPDAEPSRPTSAIAWPIALAGFAVVATGLYLAARSDLDPAISALLIMVVGFCPAVLFDGAPKPSGLGATWLRAALNRVVRRALSRLTKRVAASGAH